MATISGDVQYSQVMGHLPTPGEPTTIASQLGDTRSFRHSMASYIQLSEGPDVLDSFFPPGYPPYPHTDCTQIACGKVDENTLTQQCMRK